MRHRGPPAAARDGAPAPEERSLTDPRFIGSFPRADVVLDPPLPEVAFLGRSNVGKSTLLNALVGARVARTSRTPGKTRMMNVFRIGSGEWGVVPPEPERASAEHLPVPLPTPRTFYFLDLPGYGYARVGRGERTAFRGLLRHALERPLLAGVVWLLDLRRDPSAEDGAVQEQFAAAGVRVLAAATKSDKLPPRQRQARAGVLRGAVGIAEDQFVLTSATTGDGVDDLRAAIEALVSEGK